MGRVGWVGKALAPGLPSPVHAMTPNPAVLISLRRERDIDPALERQLADWVGALGFEPLVAPDGREAVAWVRRRPFAASLFDWRSDDGDGVASWRSIHEILGRRLVLMTREPRRGLWFEALCEGVGAVLPLPAREAMVRAALLAAVGDAWSSPATTRRRF